MKKYAERNISLLINPSQGHRRPISCWNIVFVAIMLCIFVGCGSSKQVLQARIWRDKEAEEALKLVAATGNLYCYRYEGCFLDFECSLGAGTKPEQKINFGHHPDDMQEVLPSQPTSRSGLLVVVRSGEAKWEISSRERFVWEKVHQNDATKKTVDINELGDHLSKEILDPGNSSGSSSSMLKGYSFTLSIPEGLEVDFAKEGLGVTEFFKDSKEIPLSDDEPITLARFEIVDKDGKVHGGWDLRCTKAKPKPKTVAYLSCRKSPGFQLFSIAASVGP